MNGIPGDAGLPGSPGFPGKDGCNGTDVSIVKLYDKINNLFHFYN